jgi:hypothetical protein
LTGHHPQLVLCTEEDAIQVNVENAPPRVVVRFGRQSDGAEDAGAVEDTVERAKLLDSLCDERFHGLLARDVARAEERLAAVGDDFVAECFAAVHIHVRQEQSCPLAVRPPKS